MGIIHPIGFFSGSPSVKSLDLESGSSQCAYISDASQTNLEPTTGSFTIEGWVNFESEPANNDYFALFSKWPGSGEFGNGQYYFRFYKEVSILTSYFLEMGIYTTTTRTFQQTAFFNQMFSTGVWYHLAGVITNTGSYYSMAGYVDGFERASGFSTGDSNPIASGSCTVGLGAISGTTPSSHATKFFDGKMKNWRFWNTARTQSQIQDNMFEELSSGTNLDLSLLLDNNLDDETSNANDFTGLNSPTYADDIPDIVPACIDLDGTCSLSATTDELGVRPSSALTGEGWFQFDNLPTSGNTMGLFSRAETPTWLGYEFWIDNTSGTYTLRFKYSYGDASGGGLAEESVTWDSPSADTWYHLAVTAVCTSGQIDTKFYVNGSQQGSTQSQSTDGTAWFTHYQYNWNFFVGRRTSSAYLDGKVDEFRFWSTDRSASELNSNKSTELDAQTNLEALYHFSQRLWDYSGNDIHLTTDGSGQTFDTSDLPF